MDTADMQPTKREEREKGVGGCGGVSGVKLHAVSKVPCNLNVHTSLWHNKTNVTVLNFSSVSSYSCSFIYRKKKKINHTELILYCSKCAEKPHNRFDLI